MSTAKRCSLHLFVLDEFSNIFPVSFLVVLQQDIKKFLRVNDSGGNITENYLYLQL